MSDRDTQNPNTEPGCDDVLPPLHVSRSYVDLHEPLALPGHCVVGDGQSECLSTKPNTDPPIVAERRIREERIMVISEQLKLYPNKLPAVEMRLRIFVAVGGVRERILAIAVKLWENPEDVSGVEQLIAMGS